MKANKILTPSKSEEIDLFVKEMEVNLNYCSRVTDSISDYQLACIRREIWASIELIVQYAENTEQALIWIKEITDPIDIPRRFGYLSLNYPSFRDTIELREALINVANVYLSKANLEGALSRLYEIYLPSSKIIKNVIVDMLNEGYAR